MSIHTQFDLTHLLDELKGCISEHMFLSGHFHDGPI